MKPPDATLTATKVHDMLRSLIWKDCELLKPFLLLSVGILLLPYALMHFVVVPAFRPDLSAASYALEVATGWSKLSFALSNLSIAILAASAFAIERPDRSHEFLASLPPTAMDVIASKFIVVFGMALFLLSINLTVALAAGRFSEQTGAAPDLWEAQDYFRMIKVSICIAGVGWAASSIAQSPLVPLLIAIISPVVPIAIFYSADYLLGGALHQNGDMRWLTDNGMLITGIWGIYLGSKWFANFETA